MLNISTMHNAELAYLLGMIAGKGTIIRDNQKTEITIEISHKNITCEGMDTELSIKASLDGIRNNLEPLIGTRISSARTKSKTFIKFFKDNEDFLIREINRYFCKFNSHKDFRIPKDIYDAPSDIKKEFMIGLADVTGYIRSSNKAYGISYNHRVYIEIPVNWFLVADIGNLLFDIDVPIQTIDWGHPNMRDPNLKDYNSGRENTWFREHQIKIFADEFEKIGFRIIHKAKALRKLAEINRLEWDKNHYAKINSTFSENKKEKYRKMIGHIEIPHHKFYWEVKKMNRPKPLHPMENSNKIPSEIRGMHFDSWKEISNKLGYKRR